jgi:hypothetical protein
LNKKVSDALIDFEREGYLIEIQIGYDKNMPSRAYEYAVSAA